MPDHEALVALTPWPSLPAAGVLCSATGHGQLIPCFMPLASSGRKRSRWVRRGRKFLTGRGFPDKFYSLSTLAEAIDSRFPLTDRDSQGGRKMNFTIGAVLMIASGILAIIAAIAWATSTSK